jgi:hypothetical protein
MLSTVIRTRVMNPMNTYMKEISNARSRHTGPRGQQVQPTRGQIAGKRAGAVFKRTHANFSLVGVSSFNLDLLRRGGEPGRHHAFRRTEKPMWPSLLLQQRSIRLF